MKAAPSTVAEEIQIQIKAGEQGIGVLEWSTTATTEGLTEAISAVADDALLGRGLRRLEVSLPAADLVARRAVLRAGFRQEGIRRAAWQLDQDSFDDVVLFGRLITDSVHGPASFSGVMNSVLPKKRCIAHVLIRDESDRVLLCTTTFKSDWELPGGIVEPEENPRQAAIREVQEELGIALPLGPLLVVDWMPHYLGWDDALEFIFDGGTISPADLDGFTLQASEIAAVQLITLGQAAAHLTQLSHRRLTVAASLQPGQIAYLERGKIP